MYEALDRHDIDILLLNDCVISWYNVIDLNYGVDTIGLPLICITIEIRRVLKPSSRRTSPRIGNGELKFTKGMAQEHP